MVLRLNHGRGRGPDWVAWLGAVIADGSVVVLLRVMLVRLRRLVLLSMLMMLLVRLLRRLLVHLLLMRLRLLGCRRP